MSALEVTTALGKFTIELNERRAPVTCAYFRRLAERGALDGGAVFRVTRASDDDPATIEVIQLGTTAGLAEARQTIMHESTAETGLAHRRGTVSASRFAPGEVYASLFVCLRDEPALDFGGARRDDGLGYAAFGEIASGFATVVAIAERAGRDEMLTEPIRIERVRLIDAIEDGENRKEALR